MQQDFQQLYQAGQLKKTDFAKTDWRMLYMIMEQPERFLKKETVLLPLRQNISNRVYRALLIGRTTGVIAMVQAVIKRLMRK